MASGPAVQLKIDHLSTFSLAAQQNAYPIFRSISLYAPTAPEEPVENAPIALLKNLVVTLRSDPEIFAPEEWSIDEIRPGQAISLQKRPLNVPHDLLFNLTEELKKLKN
ncbi:hypothetical protein ACJJIO_19840 [Microbulbifer sp. TRSA005]